jgi:translation initiation factor 6
MKLLRTKINNTPYLGVYAVCTDYFCIVPSNILKKEEDVLKKNLKTKIIKTSINDSPLIGVYLLAYKDKVVVSKNSIKENEIKVLEKEGIKIKFVDEEYNALGNLISLNSNYGFASSLVSDKTISEISSFLEIPIEKKKLLSLDILGSILYVNDYLFLVNPNIDEKDFNYFKKKLKVEGVATTLNYGGLFVGNDVIANKHAVLVGDNTSNIELMKVDDVVLMFEENKGVENL